MGHLKHEMREFGRAYMMSLKVIGYIYFIPIYLAVLIMSAYCCLFILITAAVVWLATRGQKRLGYTVRTRRMFGLPVWF